MSRATTYEAEEILITILHAPRDGSEEGVREERSIRKVLRIVKKHNARKARNRRFTGSKERKA